jgi:hypothetical protein
MTGIVFAFFGIEFGIIFLLRRVLGIGIYLKLSFGGVRFINFFSINDIIVSYFIIIAYFLLGITR